MPTYLYHCKEHGEFEEFHSITEQLLECPQCAAEGKISEEPPTRLIASGTTFILNSGGVGWAKNSYSS